ncbi:MAG: transcription antitermination factor NusB [Phycisphaeraceae bacterium]|nr:transcription antitermination factor NusB [Phycisphaeraceae bacterium]
MPKRHELRRLALQLLYQIDVRGEDDMPTIRRNLDDSRIEPKLIEPAWNLACATWADHAEADALVAEIAPEWPTGRQPPVDRAIMRLAYYEMRRGFAPAVVAISEAIRLADEFAGEQTPRFINGVLDKVAQRLRDSGLMAEVDQKAAESEGDWLSDALTPGPVKPAASPRTDPPSKGNEAASRK